MERSSKVLDELCEQGLRDELLATGRALDLEVLMCEIPNASDPGAAGTIEKYVFLWTAYCLLSSKIHFLHEAHEAWCRDLSDLTLQRALGKSDGVAFLVRDVLITWRYVRAMVCVLEAAEDTPRIGWYPFH